MWSHCCRPSVLNYLIMRHQGGSVSNMYVSKPLTICHLFCVTDERFEIKYGLHNNSDSGLCNYSIIEEFTHLGLDDPIKQYVHMSHLPHTCKYCLLVDLEMTHASIMALYETFPVV